MNKKITVLEVKQGDKIKYVGPYEYGYRPELVDSILGAGDFTNSPSGTFGHLGGAFRLPTDKVFAFSAISVDSIEMVEVELTATEVSRKSVRP